MFALLVHQGMPSSHHIHRVRKQGICWSSATCWKDKGNRHRKSPFWRLHFIQVLSFPVAVAVILRLTALSVKDVTLLSMKNSCVFYLGITHILNALTGQDRYICIDICVHLQNAVADWVHLCWFCRAELYYLYQDYKILRLSYKSPQFFQEHL